MSIGHPSVETLLVRHGNTAAGRAAARAEIEQVFVEQARMDARLAGLSINCEDSVRFGTTHHCRNNGSTCLCVCHDPAPEPAGGSGP